MSEISYDVVVLGAGIGGVSAAVAAARMGVKVLLIDKLPEIGGTSIHSPVGLVCTFQDAKGRPINRGLFEEFFPKVFADLSRTMKLYNEKDLAHAYRKAIDAEKNLIVWTGTELDSVITDGDRITALKLRGKHEGTVAGKMFIDASAEGILGWKAGAQVMRGRELDGGMQPATVTFKVVDIDWTKLKVGKPVNEMRNFKENEMVMAELQPLYVELQRTGQTSNVRQGVLCFPYPEENALLFNSTRILNIDPNDDASVQAGWKEGEKQVKELFYGAIKKHPAFANARIEFISPKLGTREGLRIVGDYVLTEKDCLSEARFDDMVAAAGYAIDIHSPTDGSTRMQSIPNSGYYHIPYRCLIAKGFKNLLMGSRCISGSHEAHSSYRIMASVSAIGQAAGVAAALATNTGDTRSVPAARIRKHLAQQKQFVEGPIED